MKKRLISGAIFIAVLALAFVLKAMVSNYFFDAAILAIGMVASYEMAQILTKMGKFNNKYVAFVFPVFLLAVVLTCIAYQQSISLIYTILIALATIVFFTIVTFALSLVTTKKTKQEMETRRIKMHICKFSLIKAANTMVAFIYPAFMITFLSFVNHFEDMSVSFSSLEGLGGKISLFVLILAFLIPIISDTFAYLVGGLVGGKKLSPKISPNKTISGAVGGLFFCVLVSVVMFLICNAIPQMQAVFSATGISLWKVAIISLLGSILGQSGDLFESFLKRKAGVKDSGKFMPGHGGMLDRFDSHIFVAPFIFVAFCILFIL